MITITDTNGRTTFLASAAIATITEAGASSQWHGIRCYVKTFDGRTLEANETAQHIAAQIDKEASHAH